MEYTTERFQVSDATVFILTEDRFERVEGLLQQKFRNRFTISVQGSPDTIPEEVKALAGRIQRLLNQELARTKQENLPFYTVCTGKTLTEDNDDAPCVNVNKE